jgi:surface carbohydrate biosynthesis protein
MSIYKTILLIDHPSRDLLFSCLIGEQLDTSYEIDFQDGFFTPNGPNFFKRIFTNEKYIITPSYNVTRTPYIRLRKKYNNSRLILLHSEQFLAPVSYYEKFNLDNQKKFNNDIALHLVWNDSFKKLLCENGIPSEKIQVVGNPKFDILKNIKRQLKSVKKNKILFITNFNAADFSDDEWAKLRDEYFLRDDDDSNNIYKKIRKEFIKSVLSIEEFCKKNCKEIIIRKHPGELSSDYEKIKSDVIKLSTEAELYKDLINSEIVFVYTSSVVFESFILNIPTFAIEWDKLSSELMQPPSEDYIWHKPDEIENIIKCPSDFKTAIDINLFEKYFGFFDEYSTTRIANVLNDFMKYDKPINKKNYFAFFNIDGLNFLIKFIYNKIAVSNFQLLFSGMLNKVNLSYLKWISNDHFISKKDINESKLKARKILNNETHI